MSEKVKPLDQEPDLPSPPEGEETDSRPRAEDLEAKYRDFFGKLSKEGEPVQVDDIEQVVMSSLEQEGYSADETTAGEIFDLVRDMIDSREDGDSMVVRFRVNGKDVESFKIGK